MKTRCPHCQTSFRITPEQLKARVGKVRCGQCQTVFNALDSLLDEGEAARAAAARPATAVPSASSAPSFSVSTPISPPIWPATAPASELPTPSVTLAPPLYVETAPTLAGEAPFAANDEPCDNDLASPATPPTDTDAEPGLSVSEAQELGRVTGLIMPRETTAIPGYSKWVEGMVTAPLALPRETPSRWPFVLASVLLVLGLTAQVVFHWRSEIVVALPSLRPAIAALAQSLGAELPLPRRVELVSIESSDLQSDPKLGNLLVLNATLRNRATFAQAIPSLELALTDTQDAAIARRVLAPGDFLAPAIAGSPFAANGEINVKLWIEARQLLAAGYRLYVFYP